MDHRVIGVLGASGGLGVSTLAVAVAMRAGPRSGVSACVEGDARGGGLDVTACLEHLPGLRWSDLTEAQGELDGAALLQALPREGALSVLAGRGTGPLPVVVNSTVDALARVCAVTVLDLGRSDRLAGRCTELVVLAGVSARHLADAAAVAPRLVAEDRAVHLVVRRGRRDAVDPEEVALRLDLPLLASWVDDPRVIADADRGRVPGSRSAGRLAEVADLVLATGEGLPGLGGPVDRRASA